MKANYTRIAILLDRSGSMVYTRVGTICGFNEFIDRQKKIPGQVDVKLVQFDDKYEPVFDKALADVPKLTLETFVPRGNTAFWDAEFRLIADLGDELSALPEDERPSKVIVMIVTDGLENASWLYTGDRVAALIKQQREVYGWDFIYLGANQDAVAVGMEMNIPAGSSMTYAANAQAMSNTMNAASSYVERSRAMPQGMSVSFSDGDRMASMVEDGK